MDIPDVIYLQVDEFPEITWCTEKIHDTDVEYVRADLLAAARSENERLREESLSDGN